MSFENSPFRFVSPFLVQAITTPRLTDPAVTASRVTHGRNILTSRANSGLLATMKKVFYVVSIHIPTVLTGHGLLQTRWGAVSSCLNLLSTAVSGRKPNAPISKNSPAPTSRKTLVLIALLLK